MFHRANQVPIFFRRFSSFYGSPFSIFKLVKNAKRVRFSYAATKTQWGCQWGFSVMICHYFHRNNAQLKNPKKDCDQKSPLLFFVRINAQFGLMHAQIITCCLVSWLGTKCLVSSINAQCLATKCLHSVQYQCLVSSCQVSSVQYQCVQSIVKCVSSVYCNAQSLIPQCLVPSCY